MKNRIQELRALRRITQQELADAVSVTRQTIISLENGRYNASLLLAHDILIPPLKIFFYSRRNDL